MADLTPSRPPSTPVVTVWSYHPDGGLSGRSPSGPDEFVRALSRDGHAILTDSRHYRPSNHYLIGVGVGHSDAEFAESGRSMAAYYENGEAHGGRWWEDTGRPFSSGVRYYGCEPVGAALRAERLRRAS